MPSEPQLFSNLTVPFRGERSYVHGTDIFPIFESCLSKLSISRIKTLELKFTAPIAGNFDVEISQTRTSAYTNSPVQMSVDDHETRHYVCIIPNQADCIHADNLKELKLADQIFESNGIFSTPDQDSFSTIEKIVFINKYMLLKQVKTVPEWFFGRLRLQNFELNHAYIVGLKLNAVTGTGLASSDIYLDSEVAGDVIFIPKT